MDDFFTFLLNIDILINSKLNINFLNILYEHF